MELIDCHTHTIYSHHGSGSVSELVSAARTKGVKTLAITEHYPLLAGIDKTNDSAMLEEELPLYLSDIYNEQAGAQENKTGITILAGAEIDYLGKDDARDLSKSALSVFDYCVLSVHFIDGMALDNSDDMELWETYSHEWCVRRYVELWIEACVSSIPAQTMAHPDLIKKFGFCEKGLFTNEMYSNMAEAARESGRAVELNTSGAYCACKEVYPSVDLLKRFCKAGVKCAVGSDAHSPHLVARGITSAYQTLYEAGYREVYVPRKRGEFELMRL